MTQLHAPSSSGGALLEFGRVVVGQLELAGSMFAVEANRFGGFSTLALRRAGDRRLFALRAVPGPVDVGIRHVVDVRTGAVLRTGNRPVRVMVVGDVLEIAPQAGECPRAESGGAAA